MAEKMSNMKANVLIEAPHLSVLACVLLDPTDQNPDVSNIQCPMHTTNHHESRGVHCDHQRSASPNNPQAQDHCRRVGLVLCTVCIIFFRRRVNRLEQNRQGTDSAQHDDDGSGLPDCWSSRTPIITTMHSTALVVIDGVCWARYV